MQGTWDRQISKLHPSTADASPSHTDDKQLDPEWLRLLWQHSFHHPNPQVWSLVHNRLMQTHLIHSPLQ